MVKTVASHTSPSSSGTAALCQKFRVQWAESKTRDGFLVPEFDAAAPCQTGDCDRLGEVLARLEVSVCGAGSQGLGSRYARCIRWRFGITQAGKQNTEGMKMNI